MKLALPALLWILAATGHAQDIDRLAFMSGNWVQRSTSEEVHENWLGPKGGVMVAVNLSVRAGKPAFFEFLRIAARDGKLVYIASPGGQPPTEFPLARLSDGAVVFENPANAYPSRIIYRRDGDVLVARVEGKRQGIEASEEWRFSRAP